MNRTDVENNVCNVLILAMSRLNSLDTNFYYKKEDDEYVMFEGICQLEPGTKYLINKLAKKKQRIDKIIILTTDVSLNEETFGVSAVELYKARILKYIDANKRNFDHIREITKVKKDKQIYSFISDYLEKREKTSNDKAIRQIGQLEQVEKLYNEIADKLSDKYDDKNIGKILKSHLFYICKDRKIYFGKNERSYVRREYKYIDEDEFFDTSINLDKSENHAIMIRDKIMKMAGDNKTVNVYLDMQGGSRTSIYTIYAAIEMIHSENIHVREQFACNYSISNFINEIVDETPRYAILKLASGMDAFIRYGKAEELNTYIRRKIGGGKSLKYEDEIVVTIQRISDAITIADPAGFDMAIENMRKLMQDIDIQENETLIENEQRDTYFQYIINDIKREYESILEKNEYQVINIIDWFNKKGFVAQALTYIEDKMPAVFLGLNDPTGIINIGLRTDDFETIKKAFTKLVYVKETDKKNIIFNFLISSYEKNKNMRFFDDILKKVSYAIFDKMFDGTADCRIISVFEKTKEELEKNILEVIVSEKIDHLSEYVEKKKEYSVKELFAIFSNPNKKNENDKKYDKVDRKQYINSYHSKEPDNKGNKKQQSIDRKVYTACLLLEGDVDSVKKENINIEIVRSVAKDIFKVKMNQNTLREYFYFLIKTVFHFKYNQNNVKINGILNQINAINNIIKGLIGAIFSSDFQLREGSKEEDFTNLRYQIWQELFDYYFKNCIESEAYTECQIEQYINENDIFLEEQGNNELFFDSKSIKIINWLNDEEIKKADETEFVEKYLKYYEINNQLQLVEERESNQLQSALVCEKNTFFNAELYCSFSQELYDLYNSYHVNGKSAEKKDKIQIYKTVAGIDNDFSEDMDMKWLHNEGIIATLKIHDNIDKDEKIRNILEETILLHKCLKSERNNTNHASTKQLRLPLNVVSKAIDIYVKNVRKMIKVIGESKEE